jgi:hypothetical protein
MKRRHFVRLLGLAAVTAAAVAIAATAPASTPPGSSLTVPTSAGSKAQNTWSGEVIPGMNPASDCSPFASAPTTDDHLVTVNVPTGAYDKVKATFVFTITWTAASPAAQTSDLILTLTDSNGTPIQSSDGGDPKESVSAVNLPAGNYHVLACGYVNGASQPYSATAVVTTVAKPAPAPIVALPGPGTVWGSPAKVTPENGYGYEPTLIGRQVRQRVRERAQGERDTGDRGRPELPDSDAQHVVGVALDRQGHDVGQHAGTHSGERREHLVGDEGDMALDDAGHVYYVDTYAGDVTLTRWTSNGLNKVIYDFTEPFIPTPEADDRPWITAHGDGPRLLLLEHGEQELQRRPVHRARVLRRRGDVGHHRRRAARLRLVPPRGRPSGRLEARVRLLHERRREAVLVRQHGRRALVHPVQRRHVQRPRRHAELSVAPGRAERHRVRALRRLERHR